MISNASFSFHTQRNIYIGPWERARAGHAENLKKGPGRPGDTTGPGWDSEDPELEGPPGAVPCLSDGQR
jgi:hypothetical protein